MIITWNDVERFLSRKNASRNEINTFRQLFNNDNFQAFIIRNHGLITEKAIRADKCAEDISKEAGVLEDLGSLDAYDLIDFIEAHILSYRQASSISPQQLSLIGEAAVKKVTNALITGLNESDPIGYSLSIIVQTGFPYQRIKGQQHFERKNGDLTVTMSAPNEIGLPSGMYPRIAFVHICSNIVKTDAKFINLGPSLKRFVVDELGRPWTTGKKGTASKWRETMVSLMATSFTSFFKVKDESKRVEGLSLESVHIAKRATLWWDTDYDELLGAEVEIDESFSDFLKKHAIPLNITALYTLCKLQSPLVFDLYCWLTYRFWRMEENQEPIVRISWKQLYGQLGTGISTVRHFIAESKKALMEVKKVYPQALFNIDNEKYLILIPSPPHVSPQRILAQNKLALEAS
jgi:hypothetical protein